MPPRALVNSFADDAGVDGAHRCAARREDVDRPRGGRSPRFLVEAWLQRGCATPSMGIRSRFRCSTSRSVPAASTAARPSGGGRRAGPIVGSVRDDSGTGGRARSLSPGTMAGGGSAVAAAEARPSPAPRTPPKQRVATPAEISRRERAEAEADGEHRHHALVLAGVAWTVSRAEQHRSCRARPAPPGQARPSWSAARSRATRCGRSATARACRAGRSAAATGRSTRRRPGCSGPREPSPWRATGRRPRTGPGCSERPDRAGRR